MNFDESSTPDEAIGRIVRELRAAEGMPLDCVRLITADLFEVEFIEVEPELYEPSVYAVYGLGLCRSARDLDEASDKWLLKAQRLLDQDQDDNGDSLSFRERVMHAVAIRADEARAAAVREIVAAGLAQCEPTAEGLVGWRDGSRE